MPTSDDQRGAVPRYNGPMAGRARVRLEPGANVWRLLRTDRDGASQTEIPNMAVAALRYFVRDVGTAGAARGPLHELVPTGPNEWRFGWVRPVRVLSVSHAEPPAPVGKLLGDRAKSVPDTVPTVSGAHPWWVLLEFFWRAPPAEIEYPGMIEGILGRRYALNAADWVLDRAVAPPRAVDPGDKTWNEAQGVKAEAAVKSATTGLAAVLKGGMGLGILALLYLLSRKL